MLQSQKVKFQAALAGPGAIQQSKTICLLVFTTQAARTKLAENKTFHPPTWFCDFGHSFRTQT